MRGFAKICDERKVTNYEAHLLTVTNAKVLRCYCLVEFSDSVSSLAFLISLQAAAVEYAKDNKVGACSIVKSFV